jgi:Kef-type K+ transport system membrane component KefB
VIHRALALILLVATVVVVRAAIPDDGTAELRATALAVGFALIAAVLAGDLVERLRLPRLSGYLLFGLACGPFAADLISRSMASDLRLVNGLAIALIAFIAGLEINFARIRQRLQAILTVGAIALVTTWVLIGAVVYFAWPWLPIAPQAQGMARLGMTLVLTTVLVSFSPTVTIAVIAESRARGPFTELTLAVVVLADLVLILAFTFVMEFMRVQTGGASEVGLMPHLSWEIVGSLAFGAAMGALFAFYLRFVGRELTVVLLGVCVILSSVGAMLKFEPLLSALAAGLVVENVAPPRGDALKRAVENGAMPVLVVFFVAAGASLQIDALATIGVLALALSLSRVGAVWIGTSLGVRRAGLQATPATMLWMGLVSQAGVTLGLAIIIGNEFPDWGGRVQTLVVALIAIHELVGPILFRSALGKAGEIGQMDSVERATSTGVA